MLIIKNNNDHDHLDDQDFIHPLSLIKRVPVTNQPFSRRNIIKAAGAVGVLGLLNACGTKFTNSSTSSTADGSSGSVYGQCVEIPTEVKGPYPLDGSNSTTNALSSIYRSNIVGSDITTTSGVPVTINLGMLDLSNSCAPLVGAAVYLWHCDQYGQYSGYSSSQNGSNAGKTFCRGIVVSDANGLATFTTVFPGWYAGRITHIHMAVYKNNNLSSTPKVSQFAFPQAVTQAVYGVAPYSSHGQNTSVTSFSADNIFSDGTTYQIASVTGSTSAGLVASLSVGVP